MRFYFFQVKINKIKIDFYQKKCGTAIKRGYKSRSLLPDYNKKKLPTTNKMKFFNIALLAASAFAMKSYEASHD